MVEHCYGGGGGSMCVAIRLVKDGVKIVAGCVVGNGGNDDHSYGFVSFVR